MAKDLNKRIEWWLVKTEPDMVRERLSRLHEAMKRRYVLEQALLIEMETKVKQVLDGANVPSITYPFYLDFGREVYARKRRLSGASLFREVGVLLEKWVLRDLKREVLERVRDEALSVAPPSAP
ncbi:MAG: hypothetical protein ACUVUR_05770 [bacterium]